MNSLSQAVKDKFRAQFKPMPPPNLEALEDNDEGAEPLLLANLAEQLQTPKESQFGTTILTQSTECPHTSMNKSGSCNNSAVFPHNELFRTHFLVCTYAHLDSGSSRPSMKKQCQAQ